MGYIVKESVEDLISSEESLEKNKKQQEYVDYIKKHILRVQKSFLKCFVPLLDKQMISEKISDEEFKDAIKKVAISIEDHDASKFGDEEFDGYREKYYPTATEKSDPEFEIRTKEKAENAWIHHYKSNWHHPKYWKNDDETINDMSLEAIIEMICDWKSFSIDDEKSDIREWYEKEAFDEKAAMSDHTREIVEEILFKVLGE